MIKISKLIFPCFFLLLASTFQTYSQSGETSFTVLNYNSLHGFEGDSLKKTKYLKWLKNHSPDVVAYQEMIGFSKHELSSFAQKYGHNHSVIMSKETGYDVTHPIAITSRYPLDKVEMRNAEMWHGYVYVQIKGIHIIATHLAPFTLKDRQKDVSLILNKVRQLPKGAMVLVAGDFNALARFDAVNYGNKLVESLKKAEGRLEPKSGTPIVKNRIIYRNNLNNGEIDYSVTDSMQAASFVDTYFLHYKTFKNSVPVKSQLKKSSILRRVDYIWMNGPLSKKSVAADIIQDEVTDALSDHYPVMAKFWIKY